MQVRNILKREAWEEFRAQITHAGIGILLPYIGAAMTFASGFLPGSEIALPYLFATASLVFMAVTVGMFYFRQLTFQRDPEGKLVCGQMMLGKRYADQPGGGKKLVGLKYGFLFVNQATFAQQYEVRPIHVTLGASVNPKPDRSVTGGLIAGGTPGHFSEAEVPVTDVMRGQLVEGQYEFDVAHGRPGNLEYVVRKRFRTFVKFNDEVEVESFEPTELNP